MNWFAGSACSMQTQSIEKHVVMGAFMKDVGDCDSDTERVGAWVSLFLSRGEGKLIQPACAALQLDRVY